MSTIRLVLASFAMTWFLSGTVWAGRCPGPLQGFAVTCQYGNCSEEIHTWRCSSAYDREVGCGMAPETCCGGEITVVAPLGCGFYQAGLDRDDILKLAESVPEGAFVPLCEGGYDEVAVAAN